jgi:ribosomal RNA-processing protein 12
MSGVSFKKSAGKKRNEQYIRQEGEDDEPLDLLDPRSMASISSRKLGRLRDDRAGARKTKVGVNEDGKLVFGGADEEENEADVDMSGAQDNSVNAYLDAVSGADAVRRGQKGRLKVKSGMQKQARRETREKDDDMDLDVEEARRVARQIMQGSGSPRSPGGGGGGAGSKKDPRQQRRALGAEKTKGQQEKQKFRGGGGVGKRGKGNVRFAGRHGRR